MSRLDRYYSACPIKGAEVLLEGAEAHHLSHVMRARPGTRVKLFDGSGCEWLAEVKTVDRGTVRLTVLSRHEVDRELPIEITLGVALPKGERQKWLVEKSVELGVWRIIPLVTARSVAHPTPQALDRLRRHVIEASKQCGRNRLMEIAEPTRLAEFVAASHNAPLRWIAHPEPSVGFGLSAGEGEAPVPIGRAWLAVGPEGGFTEEEVADACAAGWRPVTLGPRILRIETAALVLVGLLLARTP